MTDLQTQRFRAIAVSFVVCMLAMLVLDLAWLGVIARDIYDTNLGPLKRPVVYWPAVAAFYLCYVAGVVAFAVVRADRPSAGLRRGALLGAFVYAAYELTNWAVIRDWPAVLVPIDIAWGTVLTAVVGGLGAASYLRLRPRSA